MREETDYIMKMIEHFAAALRRAAQRRKARSFEEAVVELDTASRKELGVDLAILKIMPAWSLAQVVADPTRLKLLAAVALERCEIARAQMDQGEADTWRRRAAELLLEAATRGAQLDEASVLLAVDTAETIGVDAQYSGAVGTLRAAKT